MKHYDVVVVGGGHAGVEAADASARMGAATALISLKRDGIGVMSCNPAIGGLGKGHLVREVDAFDGIMARAGDMAGIQYRLLNRRKGPAVQGPRIQADRALYREAVQTLLSQRQGLDIIEGEAVSFGIEGDRITGVELADGSFLQARAVILTSGTFLNGVIHVGPERSTGGRVGDPASECLAAMLREIAPGRGRLKTGTPPRLDGRTIAWDKLEVQEGDEEPMMLSFLNDRPQVRQIACGITHTNERTHQIVRDNLSLSAMYGGHIEGVGPRYCPSIEDKIVRFSEKDSHQVFLEPEGLNDHTVYPNGISTSLPAHVQEAYVRSIAGLEEVQILQAGYAIEYDYFDPCGLSRGLQVNALKGLFFAGQINGTTGYEEAAAQGILAGMNAVRYARGEGEIVLQRSDSYIGVMVDDLVTRGVTEPYRMFTSRAEYRLTLRVDNADQRLTPLGIELGLVGEDRALAFAEKMARLEAGKAVMSDQGFSPRELETVGISVSKDGVRRTALEVMAFPDVTRSQIETLVPAVSEISAADFLQLHSQSLYAAYEERQRAQVEIMRREEGQIIPAEFDYEMVSGLSNELKLKLQRARPESLAQASRIEGMTPAAIALIHIRIKMLARGRQEASA
ncbi:tRNA uridine-5-carboxymethylaminomethyl(34) synthesis enzyme MnmG [Falsigemmobacter intermedius]|uniref:tRNA uridine 5-carboxymethylaminomethyl modification enzyme MnmG n=1 Tax=Falsigemmobacter intermedius TaxID=1553448 RepID=A0A3S3W0K8_9RHOB|nr:tRNA uridine-5-carboxymethylaminomethyl(34) synthesis enzyme MnmG [Falsigemmobacter intermedius]RWY45586.1 tRNA uridine-5-carboxymethylaminomethyl(34) synthesis enzyme MnmG [Falsigemmobacter intermedius]